MDNHTIGVGLLITGLLVSIGIFFTYGSGSAYVAPYKTGTGWEAIRAKTSFDGEGTYPLDPYELKVESDIPLFGECKYSAWRISLLNTETNSYYPETYCPAMYALESEDDIPKEWGAEEKTENKEIADGVYMSSEIWVGESEGKIFMSVTEKIEEEEEIKGYVHVRRGAEGIKTFVEDERSISIYDDTYSYHVDTEELKVKLGYDFNFAEDDLKGELYIDGDTKKQFGFNEIEDQSITASVEPDGEREAEIVLYDTESNASDSTEFTVKTGSDIDSNESVNGEVTGIDAVYDDKNEILSVGVEVENIEGTTNLYFNVDGDTKYIEEYPSNGEYEKSFDLTKDQGEVETETELYSADGELLSSGTQVVKTDTKTTNGDYNGGGPGLNDSPNYLALSLLVVFGALGIGFIMLQKGGIER